MESSDLSKEQVKQVCAKLGRLLTGQEITQAELANVSGYSQSSLSRLFSGKHPPSIEAVFRILNAINDLSGQSFTLKNIDYAEPENEPETGQL